MRSETLGRRALCLLFLFVGACGGAVLDGHRARVARAADAQVPVQLRFVAGNLRVVVPGRLGDDAVSWAIDTGASDHSVTRSRAQKGGLLSPVAMTDWTGADGAVELTPKTTPVSVTVFGGQPSPPRSLVTLAVFDDTLAGLLSAQRLAGDGASVELDLPRKRLLSLRGPAAARARDEVARHGARVTAWRRSDEAHLPVVAASVDGHPVTLVVDTGSPTTVLFADTEAGVLATMRATKHATAFGGRADVALVPSADVRVARASWRGRIGVFPRVGDGLDGVDGWLGLDVLRGCTIVLDRASTGAIACEPPKDALDTAPAFAGITPPPADVLAAHPPALPRGAIARLGCKFVTADELATWAEARALSPEEAREPMLRARIFRHVVSTRGMDVGALVPAATVDRAVDAIRTRENLDGPALDAALAAQHLTMAVFRAMLRDQLLQYVVMTRFVAPRARQAHGGRTPDDLDARARAFAARAGDRLARVSVVREGARCEERWPGYHLERVVLSGLGAADQRAVLLALGRWLAGRELVLDAFGTLPPQLEAAIAKVFAGRHLEPRFSLRAEPTALRVHVTLRPTDP